MVDALKVSKARLRHEMLAKRDALSAEERLKKSDEVASRLFKQPDIIKAKNIFVYVSFRSEVDTYSMINAFIEQGKTVSVPFVDMKKKSMISCRIKSQKNDLTPGTFGVPEPVPEKIDPVSPAELDITLVPGAVFGQDGSRIGYGGGFYDRFLQKNKVKSYALAFDLQIVDSAPFDLLTDMKVDYIVTEKRVFECK